MPLPEQSVTLTKQQVEELSRRFSSFRHDVNGCLALVVAATELIRYSPDVIKRMSGTLVEQPPKIAGKLNEFVEECERSLGMRNSDPGWFGALWKWSNAVGSAPPAALQVTPEDAKNVHGEIMQLGKELTQLGFVISGVRALSQLNPAGVADTLSNVGEQFSKAALKFDQAATKLEKTFEIVDNGSRRLASGTPSGPITLSPDEVALFHRRLTNLQKDIHEHLMPLVELSRLARHAPQDLATRAGEFSKQPPRISAEMQHFGVDFDRTFAIQRGGG